MLSKIDLSKVTFSPKWRRILKSENSECFTSIYLDLLELSNSRTFVYKENNNSVATCGNKISKEQIELLRELGVHEEILCYDKDYRTYEEMLVVQEKYIKIGETLSNYFRTSIIMDYGILLEYKDSPIDEGKEVFKELYKYRYYI